VRWPGKNAEHYFFLDFFVSPELAKDQSRKKEKDKNETP